jgi:glycosyltransferase 2 family protein
MADPIAGTIRASSEAAMPANPSRWRRYLGVLLCIGVSGLFLYLAARKADFLEVRQALGAMYLRWLLPIVIISLVDFWLRAVRWTWMFPPQSRPTVRQAFSIFMIGALTNNLVPGRLGDVARGGMIGRLLPALGTSGALATVVLEKVVDGLMLLALLGLAFLMAPLPLWLAESGALGSLVFLGSLLLLFVINAHGKANGTVSAITPQQFRFAKIVSAIQRLVHRFALGLTALNSQRQAMAVLMLTLVIWFLDFSIMFIVFRMFGLDLPFTAAIVTGVMVSVGMMLPAAPGAIGTYQFFTVTGLQLYLVPESQALAMAVFLNLFVFAVTTLLGLIALSAEGMSWSGLRHPKIFPA